MELHKPVISPTVGKRQRLAIDGARAERRAQSLQRGRSPLRRSASTPCATKPTLKDVIVTVAAVLFAKPSLTTSDVARRHAIEALVHKEAAQG